MDKYRNAAFRLAQQHWPWRTIASWSARQTSAPDKEVKVGLVRVGHMAMDLGTETDQQTESSQG